MGLRRSMPGAAMLAALVALAAGQQAEAGPSRHRHPRLHHARSDRARPPVVLTVPGDGTLPPELARFAGFPYNMPGYRYDYADGCLFRLGGPFGEGPAAGPCPFGLGR